jgi:DNA-directed RNA polymerase specialized sigma24 family protein
MITEVCKAKKTANAFLLRAIEVEAKRTWVNHLYLAYYNAIVMKIQKVLRKYHTSPHLEDELTSKVLEKFEERIIVTTSRPNNRDGDTELLWVLKAASTIAQDELEKVKRIGYLSTNTPGISDGSPTDYITLNDCIDKLPEPSRGYIKLKMQGYTIEEISIMVGKPYHYVRRQVVEAKIKIAICYYGKDIR